MNEIANWIVASTTGSEPVPAKNLHARTLGLLGGSTRWMRSHGCQRRAAAGWISAMDGRIEFLQDTERQDLNRNLDRLAASECREDVPTVLFGLTVAGVAMQTAGALLPMAK